MALNFYKELTVWQKSMKLVIRVFKETEKFPKSEIYGLTSQIRRATVAIPANIAEGSTRGHLKEYVQFVQIAYSSGSELETLLILSRELKFIAETTFDKLNTDLDEILRMLKSLVNSLKRKK